jgi:hypothetical protein
MSGDFFVFQQCGAMDYFLKREGEEFALTFPSIALAFEYARSCADNSESQFVLLDMYGMPIVEVPVKHLSRQHLAPLDQLKALVQRHIKSGGCYRVPVFWLRRCWRLEALQNPEWKMHAIRAFAADNDWIVEMQNVYDGFSVEFKSKSVANSDWPEALQRDIQSSDCVPAEIHRLEESAGS